MFEFREMNNFNPMSFKALYLRMRLYIQHSLLLKANYIYQLPLENAQAIDRR